MRNSLLCLVAHVRQAKSLAADFPVTGINHQVMFFPHLSRELQHVDAFIVFHAGQRFRAESFLGEKIESCPAHPRRSYEFISDRVRDASAKYGVNSISLLAIKS